MTKKAPELFRIVVTFRDGGRKIIDVYGKPEAKLRYKVALHSAAKVGGWVDVQDTNYKRVSFPNS